MFATDIKPLVEEALRDPRTFPWETWFFVAVVALVCAWLYTYVTETGKQRAIQDRLAENTKIVESLKSQFDQASHAAKVQFETEFRIYKEVWVSVLSLRNATLSLRPVLDKRDPAETPQAEQRRRLGDFYKAFYDFRKIAEENKPFYPEDIWKELNALLQLMHGEAIAYRMDSPEKDFDKYWTDSEKNEKQILNAVENICNRIRDRPGSIAKGL